MSSLRTLIRVDIKIDQQWAIGAAPDLHYRPSAVTGEQVTRLPVQRDPNGEFSLPATSLVGGLARHIGPAASDWLGSANGDDTVPSQLRCLAATIHRAQNAAVEVTTTAINAGRRAAEQHALRTEELLEPAEVTWWLEWDHHDDHLRLADLIDMLVDWRPVVGRHRSANLGRAFVQAVHHRTFDLANDDDLTWWLAERPTFSWSRGPLPNPQWTRRAGLHRENVGSRLLACRFTVSDALHIGGAGRRLTDQGREVTSTKPVLPGTSWRGVFRHRVRHIVRVSTGDESEVEATTARLFGSGRSGGASADAGHRGQLRFGDSPVDGTVRTRTHVAIDRISGGAAQLSAEDPLDDVGLLFSVDFFGSGASVELIVYNDSGRPVSPADRRLLEAVIRDLDDGIIGVGGMASRGYGTLNLQGEIEWGDFAS